jgi:hypothetical protein
MIPAGSNSRLLDHEFKTAFRISTRALFRVAKQKNCSRIKPVLHDRVFTHAAVLLSVHVLKTAT